MIFVDTGAWFAMAVKNDPDHSAAMRWLSSNREPLVTTDYVLASFVDCTSFAVMERLGITHAFAFDSHFDEYPGLIKVPR